MVQWEQPWEIPIHKTMQGQKRFTAVYISCSYLSPSPAEQPLGTLLVKTKMPKGHP